MSREGLNALGQETSSCPTQFYFPEANAPGEVCSRGGVLLASERLHGLDGGGADGGVKAEDQAH